MENEGYLGRINHPARSNHRVIRFQMEEEMIGASNIHHMLTLMNILSSFMVKQGTNAHQSIDVWSSPINC